MLDSLTVQNLCARQAWFDRKGGRRQAGNSAQQNHALHVAYCRFYYLEANLSSEHAPEKGYDIIHIGLVVMKNKESYNAAPEDHDISKPCRLRS